MESSFDVHAICNKIKNDSCDKIVDVICNRLNDERYTITNISYSSIRCIKPNDSTTDIYSILGYIADDLIGMSTIPDGADIESIKANLFFCITINDSFYEIRF